MPNIDGKYGEVTTEFGQFEKDEPVVVFRGRDKLLPDLLKVYKILCEVAGSPEHHLNLIHQSAQRVRNWQRSNYSKVPDSNAHMDRIDH